MNWSKVEIGTEDSKKLELLIDWVDEEDSKINSKLKNPTVFDSLPKVAKDHKKYDLNHKSKEQDLYTHLGETIKGGNLGNYRLD